MLAWEALLPNPGLTETSTLLELVLAFFLFFLKKVNSSFLGNVLSE